MNLCFATIVSANYLAYAAVLRDSLALHAPGCRLEVLVVDRPTSAIKTTLERLALNATFAAELQLPDFERLAYQFDLVELNTALKPSFLKRLISQGHRQVVYLDPDICLYAPPSPIAEALASHEIVLIPHALAPAMDGLRPSDIDFLRLGSYNLGFIAVRDGEQSRRMLDWWEARCLAYGFNDPTFGVFVDQKWMDLVPAYFGEVGILKHRGCNVAYWNLHERGVSDIGGGYQVGEEPLVFFHFSGVKAHAPDQLSRHQNRHQLAPGSVLARLVADYCGRLLAAGHADLARQPYGFGSLSDGTPITTTMRRAACCDGVTVLQPFDAESSFQKSLRAAGITAPAPELAALATTNTMDFNQDDRRVVLVNRLLRTLVRIAGIHRVGLLLRYAIFLVWQSHLPAVLLRRPFVLRHGVGADKPPARTP